MNTPFKSTSASLADPHFTTNYLARKFNKDMVVVEYLQLKKEVNDIAFSVANSRGEGTFMVINLGGTCKVLFIFSTVNQLTNNINITA